MKTIIKSSLAVTALALALASGSVTAQQQAGLVTVNIPDVELLNNIANDLSVNVSQVPVTVQVPVGIAATVCEVNANVLAEQARDGAATCEAKNTSSAFTQTIQRQMNQQGRSS